MDGAFYILALVSFTLLIWSVWTIVQMPYAGMTVSKGYRVLSVDHANARPGDIQPGDEIVALNGIPIAELDSPFQGLHPGDIATYTIRRNGQLLQISITLASMSAGALVADLEPVLLGFVFWLSSMAIWLLSPGSGVKRIFYLLGQVAAIMFAAGAVSTFKNNSIENYLFATTLILLAPIVLHFYLIFPPLKQTRLNRSVLYVSYAIAILLIIAYFLVSLAKVQATWLQIISSQETTFAFIFIVLIIALASLLSPRSEISIRSGRQQRLLIAGMAFSVLPILLLSIFPLIIFGHPFINYDWTFPFLILLPISYAYAVHEENLEKFDRILKQSLSFLILFGVFIASYFITLAVLQKVNLPRQQGPLVAGIVMTILAFLTLPSFLNQIGSVLDRFFYGHWYDYRSIVQRSSHQLSGTIRLEELAQNLLQNVRNMRFKEAALLWAREETLTPYRHFGFPPEIATVFQLKKNDPIAQRLIAIGKPCRTEEIISAKDIEHLPPDKRTFFVGQRVHIWLPLISGQKELLGVLLLGRRQSDEALDQDDWAILDTIADQTSLAAENIHLVETLRNQLEIMQQMQQELKETKWRLAENRERERLEMAQLLHDGPIQDIYGVAYQLAIWRKRHGKEKDPELSAIETDLMAIENSLRSFSTELRPPALESFGLEGAIRSHISKLQETHPELEVLPNLMSTNNKISHEKKLALFRIYQESVRNAIRHAHATKIWVRLEIEENYIHLEIRDNGQGFELPEKWMDFARQGHLGILGITERAEAIGGRLEVRSSPGEGTIISVRVAQDAKDENDPAMAPSLHPRQVATPGEIDSNHK